VSLHKATLKKAMWNEEDYSKTIGNLIGRVRRVGKNGQVAFEKIDKMLRNEFVGREILVAQKHGDFSFANILIDENRYKILGIIDWDNSECGHPLLIDLINLIESTYNFKDLELGYTITNILLKDKLTREEKAVLRRYVSAFGYSEDLILPYTILYWLYHLDSQLKYNFLIYNPRWMRENYYNVITEIDKIF
jgi:thiamine kinase-like enzyme